jgi:hypothetical protein
MRHLKVSIITLVFLSMSSPLYPQKILKKINKYVLIDVDQSSGYRINDEIFVYRGGVSGKGKTIGKVRILEFQTDRCVGKIIYEQLADEIRIGDYVKLNRPNYQAKDESDKEIFSDSYFSNSNEDQIPLSTHQHSSLNQQEQKILQTGNVLITGSASLSGLPGIAYWGGIEFAVTDHITIGGMLGQYNYQFYYEYWSFEWAIEVSILQIMAMASYHVQLESLPKLELNVSGYLGHTKIDVSTGLKDASELVSEDVKGFQDGITVGGRYFLSNNIALYGAVGDGVGNIIVGLTLKL